MQMRPGPQPSRWKIAYLLRAEMTPDLREEGPGSLSTDSLVATTPISFQFLHGLKVSPTVGKLPQITPAESEKSFLPAFRSSAEPRPYREQKHEEPGE